jgi:DnaB-like helicase N terminal domain/Protein of unknown function (DUF3987)
MMNGEDGYNGPSGIPIVGARSHISRYLGDRLPPHHIEAEMGTLAAILLDEEDAITDQIMAILVPEDFYRDSHQIMFRAMTRMHDAGIVIDGVTLPDELGRESFLAAGGDDYMAEIIRAVPNESNGVYYANIVKQKAVNRAQIEVGTEMIRDGYSDQFTAEELVTMAAEKIHRLEAIVTPDEEASFSDTPLRMGEAAFRGLAASVVACVMPETEACREIILLQFLTAIGNLFGPWPHFKVGATKHRCNLFTCIVAPTGWAKGMSWDAIEWSLGQANREWTAKPFLSGMTSGEGVIMEAKELSGPVLAVETEFARTLVNMNREGNSLNAILRQGWESEKMRIPTKNNPIYVEGVHLSVIAHVPPAELKGKLSPGDIENGLVNRFLWASAYLWQLLARGGSLENMEIALDPYTLAISDAVTFANGLRHSFRRTDKAEAMWESLYPTLRLRPPGPHGSATARAAALSMRLALIYAVLDRRFEVDVDHLESAMAVWDYCDATAKTIFGDGKHDVKMARLLAGLDAAPEGMTRTQIARHVFKSHIAKDELTRLLEMARASGNLVYTGENSTGTKPQSWMHRKYLGTAHSAYLRTGPHKD